MANLAHLNALSLEYLGINKSITEKRRIIDYVCANEKKAIEKMPPGIERSTKLLAINDQVRVHEEMIDEMATQEAELKGQILDILHEGEFPTNEDILFEYQHPTYFSLKYNADDIFVSDFFTRL